MYQYSSLDVLMNIFYGNLYTILLKIGFATQAFYDYYSYSYVGMLFHSFP